MSNYVPGHGPLDAKIMVVGEAPGREEDECGIPFVGGSGTLMTEYFGRHGVRRNVREAKQGHVESEYFCTNLARKRPAGNKFTKLIGTDTLERGLDELREEILSVDPNVIVAMGNWPLWYLTGKCGTKNNKPKPGSGIMNYRGSILESTMVEGKKVVASMHPAFVYRVYKMRTVFNLDIARAVQQSEFPEIKLPEFEVLVDPPNVEEIVHEMLQAELLSFDIETFGPGEMSCFGVTDSVDRALVLTYQNARGFSQYARPILESSVPKVAQYGTYDCNFLKFFYGWDVRNYAFDTYIAAGEIAPELPKGLDFLTSIYTLLPYYKEERKRWKKTMDLDMLWHYNAKDVVATLMIAREQMKELEELYGWRMEQGTLVSTGQAVA